MAFISGAFSNPSSPTLQNPTHQDMALGAYGQQQAFLNALNGQNGIQNQSNIFNQEQGTANQLQGLANGVGPNPALDQFHQATAQNVAMQNALMAGQRGGSANAGLIAREAAQQGANTQQQAAGQSATLQAQQQLAAIGALQNQQGMLGNLASNQVANYGNYGQGEQQTLLNSIAQQNNAAIGAQSNVNNANSANLGSSLGVVGSGIKAFAPQPASGGAAGGAAAGFKGGETTQIKKIKSKAAEHLLSKKAPLVGEQFASEGERVPGKAKVKGDSLKNDNVPALLSPGEVVIPRHVMNSSDPVGGAAKFVAAVMAKHGGMKRKTA